MPPRFSPRSFVEPPEAFGDPDATARWRPPVSDEDLGRYMEARYLHLACAEVTQLLAARGMSRKDFAELLNENPANVRRKINGEYPATIADVLRWA